MFNGHCPPLEGLGGNSFIFLEPTVPPESHHSPQSLGEDAATHLAGAQLAIDEDDWHLLDLEATLLSCELHFNLECIALEANGIEVYSFQDSAMVADETSKTVRW